MAAFWVSVRLSWSFLAGLGRPDPTACRRPACARTPPTPPRRSRPRRLRQHGPGPGAPAPVAADRRPASAGPPRPALDSSAAPPLARRRRVPGRAAASPARPPARSAPNARATDAILPLPTRRRVAVLVSSLAPLPWGIGPRRTAADPRHCSPHRCAVRLYYAPDLSSRSGCSSKRSSRTPRLSRRRVSVVGVEVAVVPELE